MSERRISEEIKERLKKKLKERLQEKEKEGEGKRLVLTEEMRRRIRERIRQRLLESREERKLEGTGLREELRGKIRERLLKLGEGEDRFSRLRRSSIWWRPLGLGFRGSGGESSLCERRLELFRMRNARLREELERKREILKEAYKIVRRVEELGGLQKIEEAMKIARDTIVKAGAKLFKEAVDMLAAETGVSKTKVSELIKKVGLKEAREILKKGGRVREGAKTIIVEGIGEKKEQMPALGVRIAERLSKSVAVENPKDLKGLNEAVFKR